MKKLLSVVLTAVMALSLSAKTTYVVWNDSAPEADEVWINTSYYIWENTYTQTNVDDALQLTSAGKGWIGGGYVSVAPFDNGVLTDGYDLVFDIKTTDKKELSVQLTSDKPEAAQSVKLSFDRNGEWHTVKLSVKKSFPKVFNAWKQPGAHGYIFSIVGGASEGAKVYLRNIRYQKSR